MKVVRSAGTAIAASIALCASVAQAQVDPIPGSLHTQNPGSFNAGTGRVVDLAIGAASNAGSVLVQPDRRILLAGQCDSGTNNDFCLARLNANGTLDLSFDGPASLGVGDGKFSFPVGLGNDFAKSLALQPDGKILVAGQCDVGFSRFSFCIARLLPNGEHDSSFGLPNSLGKVSVAGALSGNDLLASVLLRPNGKIVLAGTCQSLTRFCVVQLNADGSLDTTFNGSGKLNFQIASNAHQVGDAKLLPDGRLLLVGSCSEATTTAFCAARIAADGSFDDSFDGPSLPAGDGRFRFAMPSAGADPGFGVATAVVVQADGMAVVGGYCNNGVHLAFCVARLRQDGTFDHQFDGPSGSGDGRFLMTIAGSANEFLRAVDMQPDGKLLLLGTCGTSVGEDFCIARLTDDGRFDRSFDGASGSANGKFLLPLVVANSDSAASIALQPDGQILVAGSCASAPNGNSRFCVARLNGGPLAASVCKLDVDGDGQIGATTDSLIVTRVLRGMRGTTVLTGIAFPPQATRTSWPVIREYLVAQCGLAVH